MVGRGGTYGDYHGDGRPVWDDQFREDEDEKRARWKATYLKRKAEGKCWQCAKLVADCACPNVKHDRHFGDIQ